jgi:acyl-CoA dehydrogenase
MSDHLDELAKAVGAVLAARPVTDAADPDGPDTALWAELDGLGFLSLAVPEELGGGGGTLADAAVVVRASAEACAAGPIAEAVFVAAPLLAAAAARLPEGPLTVGVGALRADEDGRISGTLRRVPWLRSAAHVVAVAGSAEGPVLAVLAIGGMPVTEGVNLAGEQRDDALLHEVRAEVYALPARAWAHEVELYGGVARALQIAGAARGVLDAALRHTGERAQFGRPLAAFQAVQQHLAVLAGHVVTTEVAAQAAVAALDSGGVDRELLAATAKAEASALARPIAAIGHQVHGAIGFTREHRLGAFTRRLWSWRDEYGDEWYWRGRIADLADDWGGDVWRLIADAGTDHARAFEGER